MSDTLYYGQFRHTLPDMNKTSKRKTIPLSETPREVTYSEKYVDFIVDKTGSNHAQKNYALTEKILHERSVTKIEEGFAEAADRSICEALKAIELSRLQGAPRVMLSSDGILTLEWHLEGEGVALIFCGDSAIGISVRRGGGLYEDYGCEVAVTQQLPPDVMSFIARLS